MAEAQFKVFRGEGAKGELFEFPVEVTEGMVVLDAVQQIQSRHANDLAAVSYTQLTLPTIYSV